MTPKFGHFWREQFVSLYRPISRTNYDGISVDYYYSAAFNWPTQSSIRLGHNTARAHSINVNHPNRGVNHGSKSTGRHRLARTRPKASKISLHGWREPFSVAAAQRFRAGMEAGKSGQPRQFGDDEQRRSFCVDCFVSGDLLAALRHTLKPCGRCHKSSYYCDDVWLGCVRACLRAPNTIRMPFRLHVQDALLVSLMFLIVARCNRNYSPKDLLFIYNVHLHSSCILFVTVENYRRIRHGAWRHSAGTWTFSHGMHAKRVDGGKNTTLRRQRFMVCEKGKSEVNRLMHGWKR